MVAITAETEKQVVVFSLGSEAYGVPIGAVREIIRMQDITRVPRMPEFVEGVVNLRGKVIPVIDLRKRLGLGAAEKSKDNRIVVVDGGGEDIGMIVDMVTEVLRLPANSVEMVSGVISSTDSEYLMGIAKLESRLIILLDLRKVLSDSEKSLSLAQAVAGAA